MLQTSATLPRDKRIALVAHDNMKDDLCAWALQHREALAAAELFATGTTGLLLQKALNLPVNLYLSGPLGGDQQVGGKIAQGDLDILVFFWDPFEPMPHDPDIKALLRVAAVWNIPVACNSATADFLVTSPHFSQPYPRKIPDYQTYLRNRAEQLAADV